MSEGTEYAFVFGDEEPLAVFLTAAVSENDTVRSALDALTVAVRVAEPELLERRREDARRIGSATKNRGCCPSAVAAGE